MNQILDNLYLGDIMGASSKETLQRIGITHILTVAMGHPAKFPSSFKYLEVKALDNDSYNLKSKFRVCIKFIKEAIKGKGKVFVHCFAGVSRSATIVIAYLMSEHRMSFQDAFKYVRSRRSIINPNDGFRKQLQTFQKELVLSYNKKTRDEDDQDNFGEEYKDNIEN